MVTFQDVGIRSAAYVSAIVLTIFFAEFPHILTVLLGTLAFGVAYHMQSPVSYSFISATIPTLATTLIVRGSSYTFWFARPVDVLAVPMWLPAMHVLVFHAALDLYWSITLVDLRLNALP